MTDPRRAPEYLVTQVAAAFSPPMDPRWGREETYRAHREQARLLADRIWGEAFTAGAQYVLSIQQAPLMFAVGLPADPDRSTP